MDRKTTIVMRIILHMAMADLAATAGLADIAVKATGTTMATDTAAVMPADILPVTRGAATKAAMTIPRNAVQVTPMILAIYPEGAKTVILAAPVPADIRRRP